MGYSADLAKSVLLSLSLSRDPLRLRACTGCHWPVSSFNVTVAAVPGVLGSLEKPFPPGRLGTRRFGWVVSQNLVLISSKTWPQLINVSSPSWSAG